MKFQHIHILWLLLVPPALFLFRRPSLRGVTYPNTGRLRQILRSPKATVAAVIPWLQMISLMIALIALARPQFLDTRTTVTARGIDIAVAIDLSSSMLAVDPAATTTRLALAKDVVRDFIRRREGDRLSVVAFGARAYPAAPLTLDHHFVISAVNALEAGAIEDGTALGDGILAAIERLRSSPKGSRTVIVLTDGRSNCGSVPPVEAASAAAALGIKVHAIGVGGKGGARFPVQDQFGETTWRMVPADLDEPVLRQVAYVTGGKYFRADGDNSLRAVFAEIDRLEKRTIQEKTTRSVQELFPYLIGCSLALLLLEQTLSCTLFRTVP